MSGLIRKENIVVLIFIILMSGVIDSLMSNNPNLLMANVVVGLTYFLGALGFFSMYESWRYTDKNKRWIILFFGLMSVLIAYFTLEALYADMYGRR